MKIIGINRRCYPQQDGPYQRMESHVTVVLVAGEIGDYAAYAGIGTPEWVARFGDKIPYAEACVHFPGQLKDELYRR